MKLHFWEYEVKTTLGHTERMEFEKKYISLLRDGDMGIVKVKYIAFPTLTTHFLVMYAPSTPHLSEYMSFVMVTDDTAAFYRTCEKADL